MDSCLNKKYVLEWSDLFEEYLDFLGKNIFQKLANLAVSQEIWLTKNVDGTYTFHFKMPCASSRTTFTPGVELEETRPDGVKVRALITIEGNRMTHIQTEKNGRVSTHVRTFDGDSVTAVTTFMVNGEEKFALKRFVLVE